MQPISIYERGRKCAEYRVKKFKLFSLLLTFFLFFRKGKKNGNQKPLSITKGIAVRVKMQVVYDSKQKNKSLNVYKSTLTFPLEPTEPRRIRLVLTF